MQTEETRQRPIGITRLAILYWSVALLGFFGYFFMIPLLGVGGAGAGPLPFEGILLAYFLLVSALFFPSALTIVAFGLWSGERWARSGTVALSLANLAFVWFAFAFGFWGGIHNRFLITFLLFDTLIQLAIIYYMFTPTAKRYLRVRAEKSVFPRWKGVFLILGLVLLVAGISLIKDSSSIVKPRAVLVESTNMTVTNERYYSGVFGAVEGDWIEFNLAATNRSFLQLRAIDLPLTQNSMVYSVDHSLDENATLHGVTYTDKVLINVTSRYYVELDNWAGHYESGPRGPDTVFVYDSDNTFSGNFYLWRMPNYYPYLLTAGGALLVASCGLLLIPTLAYLRFKAKHFGMTL
jgi:hypothetical protein